LTAFYALRSLLFVLFLGITVVPWALSVLVVSIFVRGKAIGVISVQSTREEGRFTGDDQKLLLRPPQRPLGPQHEQRSADLDLHRRLSV